MKVTWVQLVRQKRDNNHESIEMSNELTGTCGFCGNRSFSHKIVREKGLFRICKECGDSQAV